MPQESKKNDKKKQPNDYLRYSGMGTQMLAVILLGVYGGSKLDNHFQTEKPYWTAAISLLAVVVALYVALKNILKK